MMAAKPKTAPTDMVVSVEAEFTTASAGAAIRRPRTHQAHQDQLDIALAEPMLKANHWNPRPAESGLLGLVYPSGPLRPGV